ncbi:hypothetical protein [Bacillus sp. 7884-1]|uniref:hypothetical protein n=1 Tax=Bacillus sp. 7884-1 TaxID=2021693 RepID=UPI000BA5F8DC|nr:hypothetical protein [Bacillus sp. 7884-1]PAE40338.1 hypothetical protein CHI06_15055 [Bacillus sp. 7884-1]
MRNSISMFRLSLSLLVSFILLISIVLPNTTIAQGNSVESKPISASKNTSVEDKIDSKLIKQFKDQDQITFLLKFEDQVDTTKVALEAAEKAKKQKLTEVSAKLQVRSAVVSTLRNTAVEK